MKLNLGGLETIDSPTPEQVGHYLRFMPAESPFVVLECMEGVFIQAVIEDDLYRVEYRENEVQWFVQTDYEKACELFWCFMDESCDLARSTDWKKLTAFNTPWHPAAVIGLVALITAGTVFAVLAELGLI